MFTVIYDKSGTGNSFIYMTSFPNLTPTTVTATNRPANEVQSLLTSQRQPAPTANSSALCEAGRTAQVTGSPGPQGRTPLMERC